MKKMWMCYYVNAVGQRDGSEYIFALSKEEAIAHYKRFFNVVAECKAVPVYDGRNRVND